MRITKRDYERLSELVNEVKTKKTKWTRRWMYGHDKKMDEDDYVSRYTSEYGEVIEVIHYRGEVDYAVDEEDATRIPHTHWGVVGAMSDRKTKWFRRLADAKEYIEGKRY